MSDPTGYAESTTVGQFHIVPAPRVANAVAYGIPRAKGTIDLPLDGNEGPAPSQTFLTNATTFHPSTLQRYPSSAALTEALAAKWNVSPDQLLVTAGGDDALDRLMRAMLCEGREIIFPVPSFEMIDRYARLAGGTIVEVPWPQGPYPLDKVLAQIRPNTAVICTVTPNNPTGAVASFSDVEQISRAAPHAAVLLDQAYAELADEDLTPRALNLPNVLVVRSMSKAYGLAGLRIGYALGAPKLIQWLRAAAGPYTVAGPSLHIALQKLTSSNTELNEYTSRVRFERNALYSLLLELGCDALPSQANFVFARLKNPISLRDALAARGIGIRAFPQKPHLTDAVRITVPGNVADFNRLCDALRQAKQEGAL
ncbi:MAG: histidinol-phosphate aminotransferase family protein [Polyangiaceae bacterium]|nr:histidinol-phosphate aminotransferase family protein [Polyangiaceae bacterium]